jgi:hypothetical protein
MMQTNMVFELGFNDGLVDGCAKCQKPMQQCYSWPH